MKNQNKIIGRSEISSRSKFGIKRFYFSFSLVAYFLLFVTAANAQFDLPTIGNIKPTISLSADPTTPLRDSAVTVTANLSGIIGSGNSNYLWFLNGAKQSEASGLNKKTFKLNTGDIGVIYRISVNVATPNGENLSDAINLTVSDIDLTWSANSQAPVAYRAKLMPTQNSVVAISALPFIYRPGTKILINSSNIIYNWIINGKLDSEKSGINKNAYILKVDNFFGNSYLVRLEVKTMDGAVYLNKYITIPVVKPQIFIYSSDSKTNRTVGVALKNLTAETRNLRFAAEAYFFTAPMKDLKWQWLVNNTEVNSDTENPWIAALNLADNFFGQLSAQIQVEVKNPNNELESAQSTIDLEINKIN